VYEPACSLSNWKLPELSVIVENGVFFKTTVAWLEGCPPDVTVPRTIAIWAKAVCTKNNAERSATTKTRLKDRILTEF
jgi:hypothetical protein